MISRKSIDEVLERARIEEVVQDFVNLKRRGTNLVGLCPFHHEKTPSFNVSPTRNIFKCFGCGRGGDSVKFVMEHEAYDFPEAIRYLAEKYNIELEETRQDAESIAAEKERESIYKLLEFAWNHFKELLHQSEEGQIAGLNYLKERGFRKKTIEDFGLGYTAEKMHSLVDKALNAGFSKELLQKAGLMTQGGTDFFRQRVIFPIFNISGKVIGFGGRQLTANKNSPKYLNSPETEVYNKRKVLYGLYQAKKAIRDADNCYLVEGYTDVISLHQAGVENVVASSGTALTAEQIRLIRRYAGRITVLYDSDPAGIKAALRGLDLILEENLDVRLALLPEGEDPDSFISKVGLSGFETFIQENSKDFILFKTQLLLEEAGKDPMRKAALVKDLVQSLAHIPEAIKRSAFITECAHRLRIEEHILVRETNKAVHDLLQQKRLGVTRDAIASERESMQQQFELESREGHTQVYALSEIEDQFQERDIVRILLNYGTKEIPDMQINPLARFILLSLDDVMDEFRHPTYQKILNTYVGLVNQGTIPGAEFFTNHEERDIQNTAIELLTFPFEYASWDEHDIPLQVQLHPDDNYKEDAIHAILRFKQKVVMAQIQKNLERISELHEAGDEKEMILHLHIHRELQQARDQITAQFKSVVLRV